MYKFTQSYLQNQVNQASPLDLILMLYNKAIGCLRLSKKSIEEGIEKPENLKKKVENLDKTLDILIYLKSCLNFEQGGEIAKNLNEIYTVLIEELFKIKVNNDIEVLEKSIETLETLKKAWEDLKRN
ncbi:MAG: flagellar export chaperone FliS [Thermodesulfobacteriaceae bacterium]|nr:flagellar export chaperone FliS [Thermodesulfobacteriaceae bacterium]MCX8041530.1 flagellar export chaperone FliS [Thermodesulfobacteriaceae bacterium]MDW8135979.1 flagellar export chaperone FliS [Thermodesulfobacterium sp.]